MAGETKLNVIVVTFNNREIGFVVDKLLQQKEIVEKPIGRPSTTSNSSAGPPSWATAACAWCSTPRHHSFFVQNYQNGQVIGSTDSVAGNPSTLY
jgi:hypothetical protein